MIQYLFQSFLEAKPRYEPVCPQLAQPLTESLMGVTIFQFLPETQQYSFVQKIW